MILSAVSLQKEGQRVKHMGILRIEARNRYIRVTRCPRQGPDMHDVPPCSQVLQPFSGSSCYHIPGNPVVPSQKLMCCVRHCYVALDGSKYLLGRYDWIHLDP